MERLQKVIAQSGLTSRRKAEELITAGRVMVNGEVIKELGTKVKKDDVILVDNKPLKQREQKVYYVLNKPAGYVSTTKDEHDRKTVMDLLTVDERVFPIGRLDFDTKGVLLFTNDGDFMNGCLNSNLEKEYFVKCKGLLRREETSKMCNGLNLGDFITKKCKIRDVKYDEKKENSSCYITITEGKYHQIKRMFEVMNHEVIDLTRIRFGSLTIDIPECSFRKCKPHEVKTMWNLINNS